MKTGITLISKFDHVDFIEDITAPYELMPTIDIITNKKQIKKILNQEFRSMVGTIEYNDFQNSDHILFFHCSIEDNQFSRNSSEEILFLWLVWIEVLIRDAWLIKDHAIECNIAYCRYSDGKNTQWSNNQLKNIGTMSTGFSRISTTFNIKELNDWNKKSEELQNYLSSKKSSYFDIFLDKSFSRIGRSLSYINSARKEQNPALKIAHYCIALEALFSTDNSELTHKLSERVAIFLIDYDLKPIDTYNEIRSYYKIRSSIMHGDYVKKNDMDNLSLTSQKCDKILRKIINAILNNPKTKEIFESNNETLTTYFNEKIFKKQ